MRTLNQGVAAFLAQGLRPRLFVRVFSGATTILSQGTKAVTGYEDRIRTFGAISQEIDPAGGMGSVSRASVNRLVLDERLTLCTEASIAPETFAAIGGAGRLIRVGAVGESYADVRNATSANDSSAVAIVVGRRWSAGNLWYSMFRGYIMPKIPAGITTCEDAFFTFTGMGNYADAAFGIQVVAAPWTDVQFILNRDPIFNDFTGWAASGNYTDSVPPLVNLAETWTSAEYGGTIYIRLNAAGRAAVVAASAAADRKLKLMLISTLDSTWGAGAGPAGNEFVMFESASARLALRYNSVTLENKDVEFLYGLETLPATVDNTALDRVWTGVVDSWSLDDLEYSLDGRQNDHKKNPLLPANIINTTVWPDCPAENIGKPYPLVCGSIFPSAVGTHEAGIGKDTSPGLAGLRQYSPCPVVRDAGASTYETPMRILVAGHVMNASLTGVPALWDSTRKTFTRFWANISADLTASDGSIYVEATPKARTCTDRTNQSSAPTKDEFIGTCFSFIPSNVSKYNGATTPEYAYAGDGINYATLTAANAYALYAFDDQTAITEQERAEIVFDLVKTGTAFLEVGLYAADTVINTTSGTALEGTDGVLTTTEGGTAKFESATATFTTSGVAAGDLLVITTGVNAGEWVISGVINETSVYLLYNTINGTSQSWKVMNPGARLEYASVSTTGQKIIPLALFTDEPRIYAVKFTITSGAGSFKISNLQVRIFNAQKEKIVQVWFDKKGGEYGSWIDAAGRTGSFNEGDLIENPAHIIEGFARTYMGLTTAEIDTGAFDTAATAVTGMKLALDEQTRKPARELLDDMAMQARLLVWWDEQDRLTCKKISSTAAFPSSGTDVPGPLNSSTDIFSITGSPASGSFTEHQILDGPRIRPTDKVYNDFVIKYRKNYATGSYAAVLTCNKDAENLTDGYLSDTTGATLKALCQTLYTRIGKTATLEVEAWAIRDEKTATALVQHLVEWYTAVRTIIEFTAGISAIEKEPGDFINVRDARIKDMYGTAVMNIKKWRGTKISPDLNSSTFTIEAIEV